MLFKQTETARNINIFVVGDTQQRVSVANKQSKTEQRAAC